MPTTSGTIEHLARDVIANGPAESVGGGALARIASDSSRIQARREVGRQMASNRRTYGGRKRDEPAGAGGSSRERPERLYGLLAGFSDLGRFRPKFTRKYPLWVCGIIRTESIGEHW